MKGGLLKKANECLQAAKSTVEGIAKDERVQTAMDQAQEYAGVAMDKVQEFAKDTRVRAAKAKAEEYAKTMKDKVVEVANDERVVVVKNKAAEYVLPWWKKACVIAEPVLKKEGTQKVIGCARTGFGWTSNWIRTNWQAGRKGRIKVIAAGVAILFVVGTVFSMGGSGNCSSSGGSGDVDLNAPITEEEEAAMNAFFGEGGGGDRVWMCEHVRCKAHCTAASKPWGDNPCRCTEPGGHWWADKGPAGNKTFQCKWCRTVLRTQARPWGPGQCGNGKSHWWLEVY